MTTLTQFLSAFFMNNISPNTHKFYIPMKRVKLIYAIVKGILINIGQTLSQEIFSIATKMSFHLGLLALITALCVRKGMDIVEDWAQSYVDLQPTGDANYI